MPGIPEDVSIDDIIIPKGRRRVNDEKVASLAKSIKAIGLLQPIVLTCDYHLIAGLHRIEAHRKLGRKTISSTLHQLSDVEAELAEIDENFERNALDALDWAKALKRRKELYEALNPQSKATTGAPLVAKRWQNSPENTGAESAPVSFTEDTAAKTGVSQRTIQEGVALGEAIPDDVAEILHDTPIARNKTELKKLAALSEEEQREAAKKIKSGKAKRVAEAAPNTNSKPRGRSKNGKPMSEVAPFKKANTTAGALLRLIDDIHRMCPNHPMHNQALNAVKQAMTILEQWKKGLAAA